MRPLSEFPAWSRAPRCSSANGCRRPPARRCTSSAKTSRPVRSYKLRGANNLLMQLSKEEIAAGVVCSSAGNHAQGFAMACRSMGIHGRVYVPAKTPKQKRDRIRYHGREFIELIAVGKTYDEAAAAALDDVARTGATLVPPYDDPRTMAGQGTHRRRTARPTRRRAGPGDRSGRRRRLHRGHHHIPGRADHAHLDAGRRTGRGRRDDRRARRGSARSRWTTSTSSSTAPR